MAVNQRLKMRRVLKSMAAYVAVIFAFCLGYVWMRVQVVETGYRIGSLQEQKAKLKEENKSLMVEAATLKSPQRLEQVAKEMGLKRPVDDQIVYLKKDSK